MFNLDLTQKSETNQASHVDDIVSTDNGHVINLEHGDPTMYYNYWKKVEDECTVTIKPTEFMSYFADNYSPSNFYQMPNFTNNVKWVHRVVGNAVTKDRYIVGGTGSSQLFLVALRTLASSLNANAKIKNKKIPVVCAEPYYSCYRDAVAEENSGIFEWGGDANKFEEEGPFIEVVTSPNNPDGICRKPVVKREGGLVIGDLAYYWPQYTPITGAADYDVMLFTLSKITGHAGSRVGWAIVKDKEAADKMAKQIWLTSIGMSHEAQSRAKKVLEHVANFYDCYSVKKTTSLRKLDEGLFEFGHHNLARRWERLRDVVKHGGMFSLMDFNPQYCNFMGKYNYPNPAFAWMATKTGEDAAKLLMTKLKIRGRSGVKFGSSITANYARVNMLGSEHSFNLLIQRLSSLQICDLN